MTKERSQNNKDCSSFLLCCSTILNLQPHLGKAGGDTIIAYTVFLSKYDFCCLAVEPGPPTYHQTIQQWPYEQYGNTPQMGQQVVTMQPVPAVHTVRNGSGGF